MPSAPHPAPTTSSSQRSAPPHPRPAPAAEIDYTGRRHRRALTDAGVWELARRIPAALGYTVRLAWSVDRLMLITVMVCQVLAGTGTAVMLLSASRVLKVLLGAHDTHQAVTAAWPDLAVAAGASAIGSVCGIMARWAARRLTPQLAIATDLALVQGHLQAPRAVYERAEFSERSQAADIGAQRTAYLAEDGHVLAQGLVQLLAAATVLGALSPVLLAVLLLAVVPRGWGALLAARADYQIHDRSINDRARRREGRAWVTRDDLADEVRLNTMQEFLYRWYEGMGERICAREIAGAAAYLRIALTAAALSGLFTAVMWLSLSALVLTGRVNLPTAGTSALAFLAASRALHHLIRAGTEIFTHSLYVADLQTHLAELETVRPGYGTACVAAPRQIRLKGVFFSYPGSGTPAMSQADLTLTRGEVVTVVGVNGAGKSTLLGLVTGLLQPTRGAVYWDGTDLATVDLAAVYAHTGYVGQHPGHWPLPARETITLGQPRCPGDHQVWDAAAQVGMDGVIGRLPGQMDALLAKSVWGGHQLSGGQRQRLACAAALYRRPGLLILDEPTSHMDACGEGQLARALRQGASERITLVVTHRLSLEHLRLADRVLVLDQGRIRQYGPVDELLAEPGSCLRALREAAQPDRRPDPLAAASPSARSPHAARVPQESRS